MTPDSSSSTAGDTRPVVAVLFGGRSSEHAVSCVSAANVLAAIDRNAYRVIPIGITRQGTWRIVEDWEKFTFDPEAMPEVTDDGTSVIPSISEHREPLLHRGADGTLSELDVVDVYFPVLHGRYGEDGTIQGIFELSNTPFVGAGVLASAVSMDKHFMKAVMANSGIPACPFVLVTEVKYEHAPEVMTARVEQLGFPAFVKPCRAGSSIGVSKINDTSELDAALRAAFEHDNKVIVEPLVDGREIECSVLGSVYDRRARTSVPSEIVVGGDHEFYDFEAKYLDLDSVELICPADVDAETTAKIQDLAARTFKAFECTGLARVDTFVTADGEVLINELNTLPGFTPSSAYPQMWAASGLEYSELISELISIAMSDHARQAANQPTS